MSPLHMSPQLTAFAFALAIFQVWMLVDAIRRRAPAYWPILILFITPAALAYFFIFNLLAAD